MWLIIQADAEEYPAGTSADLTERLIRPPLIVRSSFSSPTSAACTFAPRSVRVGIARQHAIGRVLMELTIYNSLGRPGPGSKGCGVRDVTVTGAVRRAGVDPRQRGSRYRAAAVRSG